MVKASYEDQSPTGNWNVAGFYSSQVVFGHIQNLINYGKIAKYGVLNFEDQFQLNKSMKDEARISAMQWYNSEFLDLIVYTIPFVKVKDDKIRLEEIKLLIERYSQLIYMTKSERNVRDRHIVEVNEAVMNNFLIKHKELVQEVLTILNRADLIFTYIDEYDVDKAKQQFFDDLINKG